MYSFAAAKIDENSEDWIKVKKEVSRFFNGKQVSQTQDTQKSSSQGNQTGAEVLPVFPFDARLKQMAGMQLEVQATEAMQREMSQQGIVVVADADLIFNANKTNQKPKNADSLGKSLSEKGQKWTSDLTSQLIQLKIPLNIVIEASQKTADKKASQKEYEISNERVWTLAEALRVPLEQANVSFRLRMSAMGNRPSDVAEAVGLINPVVLRVFYEKPTQEKK
jgi:hypothetical protein